MEEFKKANQLINLEQQGSLAVTTSSDLQKQIVQQDVKINIVEDMDNYLRSQTPRVVPATLIVQDPAYSSHGVKIQ